MLEWSDLHIFLTVAEQGSLSAAARELGLSQPTVGRRLTALEEQLGSALVVRTARGLTLTEAGGTILDNARRMGQEAMAIERAAESQNSGLSGMVTVSAAEGLGTKWLPKALAPLREQYPDITLHIRVENRVADLVKREADIALRMFRPTQASLIARRVATIGFGLYAARSYIERYGAPASIEDLADHDMIYAGHGLSEPFSDIYASRLPPMGRVVFESNSPTAMITATRAGYGVGIHSHLWASDYADLVRILPDTDVGEIELWLVTHEELKRSARIHAVFDFIAERCRAFSPYFAGGHKALEPA